MADYDKYQRSAAKTGAAEGEAAGRAKGGGLGAAVGTGVGFQKDWKAKKKRQVSAEKGARAKVEQSNLMANMQQKFSDDQILTSSMAEPIEPVRGKGQFDRFEQRTFG